MELNLVINLDEDVKRIQIQGFTWWTLTLPPLDASIEEELMVLVRKRFLSLSGGVFRGTLVLVPLRLLGVEGVPKIVLLHRILSI